MPSGSSNIQLAKSQSGKDLPIPGLGPSVTVAYDTSTASAATLASTSGSAEPFIAVRVTPTTACFMTSAAAPTALDDGTHHYLPAGIPQDFIVPASHKLAFIKQTTAGSAFITVLI